MIPVAEGAGRTGVHAAIACTPARWPWSMVIDEDAPAATLFDELVKRRDARGDDVSRLFLMPVERQA